MPICYDVLVIGSGAAGLGLALSFSKKTRIAILSKDNLTAGSSPYAQGGIAAVMDTKEDEDSVELHIQDTINAGSGLCDLRAVRMTVMQAKLAINWLIQRGIQFNVNNTGTYHLTKEGGHSQRRILHSADRTGFVIVKTLAEQVISRHNINCFTDHIVIDLLINKKRCIGALVYDIKQKRSLYFYATHTVLATGGASFIYLHTSNPTNTSGDGLAMAWRAGCRIANLEFNQFHPTCLYHPSINDNHYLISEVVRGEGGYLLLPNGERFMLHYDKRGEMAPRDIVARAIDTELKEHNLDHVFLDISHRSANFIKKAFPTIYMTCLKFGFDMTKEALPVVPAAHYTCGGVVTDLQGQTDVYGLYAIGEVAYTGLHGANRIASNSLLECLVFSANCARIIKIKNSTAFILQPAYGKQKIEEPFFSPPVFSPSTPIRRLQNEGSKKLIHKIRKIMWENVGIIRSNKQLIKAQNELQQLIQKVNIISSSQTLNNSLIELKNILTVAQLTIESALKRKESRGLHYNTDYPFTLDEAKNTILYPSIRE